MMLFGLNFALAMVDGVGAYGSLLHWGLTIAFVGSAFLIFIYRWYRGSLDMDEEPKMQMMSNEFEENHDPKHKP